MCASDSLHEDGRGLGANRPLHEAGLGGDAHDEEYGALRRGQRAASSATAKLEAMRADLDQKVEKAKADTGKAVAA